MTLVICARSRVPLKVDGESRQNGYKAELVQKFFVGIALAYLMKAKMFHRGSKGASPNYFSKITSL